jgi:NADPH-dependent 2,4-dienoyl-CoA reductase/sulfur reductase-like enzyme
VADFLAQRGHEVTVVYATQQPAPLMGRYIIGGILGRLDAAGVRLRFMEEVVGIGERTAELRNVYSLRTRPSEEFDSVVLACGSVADPALYDELRTELPDVHVLGDAYAPRRLVFATRQAYALAEQLVGAAAQ